MSTALLVVQFEWPDDLRTFKEWNALIRECLDPLHRENVAIEGWKFATGELQDV